MAVTKAPNAINGLTLPTTVLNVKGAWAEFTSSAPENIVGIMFTLPNVNASLSGNKGVLVDIGIGAASSEVAIVENILWRCSGNSGDGGPFMSAYLPIKIAAGERIVGRAQANPVVNTNGPIVALHLIGGSGNSGYRTATTYGADTTNTLGTPIDPGGTPDTYGSWIEISSAISRDINWLSIFISGIDNPSAASARFAFQVGTGSAGSEVVIVPDISFVSNTNEMYTPMSWSFPLPTKISAGTRLAVRAKCTINDASDRLFDIVLIGFDDKPSSGKGAGGNKGKKGGGGGLNIISPGGANVMNIGNPGLDISIGQ